MTVSHPYYTSPEDIRHSWLVASNEMEKFAEANGGAILHFRFLCLSGIVQSYIDPVALRTGPKNQEMRGHDYTWWAVARSLQAAANKQEGRLVLETFVLVSPQGVPLLWTSPLSYRLGVVEK